MATSFDSVVPVLRIFSVDKAREFYLDFLGFRVDWEHRHADGLPLYMQVSRGGMVLHLTEHHGDACPGATVYVYARDLAVLHGELLAKDYPYARPGLQEQPWGMREMIVADPFGNRLRFGEPI